METAHLPLVLGIVAVMSFMGAGIAATFERSRRHRASDIVTVGLDVLCLLTAGIMIVLLIVLP
ncbi:hypothetical protein [Rhizobium sp. BK661]|uniref:hypothetical protein n=1 Tax=Rhizobium sp. BK661 TaxID=2586991 RepID=UPI0021676B1B|nr:hypothetical protein [Rhizobium sp. BK661]MCS3742162.1 hypothetical protein [Rhizobium sp. BK661]